MPTLLYAECEDKRYRNSPMNKLPEMPDYDGDSMSVSGLKPTAIKRQSSKTLAKRRNKNKVAKVTRRLNRQNKK